MSRVEANFKTYQLVERGKFTLGNLSEAENNYININYNKFADYFLLRLSVDGKSKETDLSADEVEELIEMLKAVMVYRAAEGCKLDARKSELKEMQY